jgi:uncharacterized membrane protein YjgN (DUF898 family)
METLLQEPPSGTSSGTSSNTPPAAPVRQRIIFHATGGEYFRIWIVNLLLTIATLGIYSAWAKVRRNQYMYSCTELAGASFEYHGKPLPILKGRIIALVLIILYNVALRVSFTAGLLMMVAVGAVLPWLVLNSLRFRLFYTSYRGIRFGFGGTLKSAYVHFLLLPILYVLSLTLALPFVHQRLKRYQHSESRFGAQHFAFDASVKDFYKRYGVLLLLIIGGGVFAGIIGAIAAGVGAAGALASSGAATLFGGIGMIAAVLGMYVWIFLLVPIFYSMIQNLIWNHTSIGPHRFESTMKWRTMSWISVTNLLAVVCTLGLFTPFAVVRWNRYHLESITLVADGSLDAFVAGADDAVSATGVGATDMLDFDLSI